jgi:hypothetical protein
MGREYTPGSPSGLVVVGVESRYELTSDGYGRALATMGSLGLGF